MYISFLSIEPCPCIGLTVSDVNKKWVLNAKAKANDGSSRPCMDSAFNTKDRTNDLNFVLCNTSNDAIILLRGNDNNNKFYSAWVENKANKK